MTNVIQSDFCLALEKNCHEMSIPQCYPGLCSTRKRLFKLYSDTMSIHPFVLNKFFHRIHA